jgi:hypothetical protein
MTRLYQAFERAREMARQDPVLGPDGGPAEDPPASIRQSTVTDTKTAIAEPWVLRTTTAIRCPECEKVQEGPLRGPWMRRFFGLMRIPPYRCRFCRRRFSGFDGETDEPVMNQLEGGVFSTFLRPADNRSFDDVIRDIARDEQEQCEHGPSSNASHGNERAKEWELRKPENWPAVGGVHRSHPRT